MKKFLQVLSAIALAAFVATLGYMIMRSEPVRRETTLFPMGGIPFTVATYGRGPDEFEADIAEVKERVEEMERCFNRFKDGSEIALVNSMEAGGRMRISPDMRRILAISREWHRTTLGAFDPTVTPLIELWKEAAENSELPDESSVSDAVSRVGMEKVRVEGETISFDGRGISLDFGAVAKGLIADEVASLLMRRGVARGVIDAGGNGLAFGTGSFRFGIQDPLRERGALMGAVDVAMGGVVTSGSYERFVTIAGRRYSHIIDPRDGMPVENGMIAATVVGGSGAGADSLATALMVLGRDEGARLIKSMNGYGALIIEEGPDGPVLWVSANIAPKLVLTREWSDRTRLF